MHVTNAYPPHVGGLERYVYNLVSKQRLLGYDVYVVTSNLPHNRFYEEKVIRLPVLYCYKGAWGEMPICPTIFRTLKQINSDIIHAHVPSKFFAESTAIYRLAAKEKKPLVITYHGYTLGFTSVNRAFTHIYDKVVTRWFLRNADKIIVMTKKYKTLVNNVLRVDYKKIEIIPSGVDDEIFNPRKYQPESAKEKFGISQENVIVFIGRLASAKGVDYLIKALPIVRGRIRDVSLLVVGDGLFKSELKDLSRKLNLNSCVKFIGEIPLEDIPQVMSLASVIVLPSLTDQMPLVLLEAMSMEKPVIATRVGGVPEVIVNGQTGLLVEKGSINELANAIVLILSNKKLASSMGKMGRRLVQKQYSWNVTTRKVLKTYESALTTYGR